MVYMNKLKLLSSVMIITMSVSGCLGNKQPPRHNQVEGTKRMPALNQQTAQPNVPFPTDEMLYETPQEPKKGLQPRTNWEDPVEPTIPIIAGAPVAAMARAQNGEIQPSPLYYYEQQQAPVVATGLEENAVGLEPSPLAAVELPAEAGYPKLNDVPQLKKQADSMKINTAKSDAKEFATEQKIDAVIPIEPQFDELTLDEFLAKEAIDEEIVEPEIVNEAATVDFSKQPLQEIKPLPQVVIPAAKEQTKQAETVIEPFADEDSKKEIAIEMEKQAPTAPVQPPAPEVVEVSDAETVAVAPRNQRIYTSSGAIELTPPSSIASRGGEMPRSRYYNRRNSSAN
jgi:hypothetical protein